MKTDVSVAKQWAWRLTIALHCILAAEIVFIILFGLARCIYACWTGEFGVWGMIGTAYTAWIVYSLVEDIVRAVRG